VVIHRKHPLFSEEENGATGYLIPRKKREKIHRDNGLKAREVQRAFSSRNLLLVEGFSYFLFVD
jgi:hypothetical protein